jgi:hypothetical protein
MERESLQKLGGFLVEIEIAFFVTLMKLCIVLRCFCIKFRRLEDSILVKFY